MPAETTNGSPAILGQRRGDDVRAGRRDVRLQRVAERRQATGREARRNSRPTTWEPRAGSFVKRTVAAPPAPGHRRTEPCAVEVGDRPARALEDREPGITGRALRDDHADCPGIAGAVHLRLVLAAAAADERDRPVRSDPAGSAALAKQAGSLRRSLPRRRAAGSPRSTLAGCRRSGTNGIRPQAARRDDRERRVEDMRVRGRADGDRIWGGRGRACRAQSEEVPVVPCGDDWDDACANDVGDGLDQRIGSRIRLRAAAGEVDDVHPVPDRLLERLDDLGCRSRSSSRRAATAR